MLMDRIIFYETSVQHLALKISGVTD